MRIDIWPDSTPIPNQPYLNRHKQKQKNSDLVLYLKIIFSEIQQAIKIWSFTVSAYRP